MSERNEVSLQTTRPQEMIALQAGAIGQYRSRDDLGRIPESVPVMIIHGKLDRMVHYKESEPLEKGIAHAKRVDLSDGVKEAQDGQYGHFVSRRSQRKAEFEAQLLTLHLANALLRLLSVVRLL